MDEGEARAAAQRKVIRRIAIGIGVVAAVLGLFGVAVVIWFFWAMSQYGSNK